MFQGKGKHFRRSNYGCSTRRESPMRALSGSLRIFLQPKKRTLWILQEFMECITARKAAKNNISRWYPLSLRFFPAIGTHRYKRMTNRQQVAPPIVAKMPQCNKNSREEIV